MGITKIYGQTTVHLGESDEEVPNIKLRYYKTKDKYFSKGERHYGVGVIKTEVKTNELNEEKQEFKHICKQKNEIENLLKVLLNNKVTPVDLRYVLEDMALL